MFTKTLALLALVAVSATAMSVETSLNKPTVLFAKFKKDFNRVYKSAEEEAKRFAIFVENIEIAAEYQRLDKGAVYTVTQHMDLSREEFAATWLGMASKPDTSDFPVAEDIPETNETSIDWVAKGAVTPVKDQAQCGSCWAFSTVAGMEGQLFVAEGKLLSMSEQDLVSCDKNGDQGCNGGLMDNAFTWIQSNGICSESAYPYTSGTGNSGTCKKTCKSVATCTGHKDVPKGSESGLYTALKKAPVSIAVDAGKFQLYKSGILDTTCGKQLDHGVTLVGAGTDGGKDYWTIKNSWGKTWGEKGYIRLVHGKDECGLADSASQPTGVKSV